jgi:hypothetical protein
VPQPGGSAAQQASPSPYNAYGGFANPSHKPSQQNLDPRQADASQYQIIFVGSRDSWRLSTLYGFPTGSETWLESILTLSSFLKATGLAYCKYRELFESGLVIPTGREEGRVLSISECLPCCLADTIRCLEGCETLQQTLLQIWVFIRLWRKLQCGCKPLSMATLVDIAITFNLFSRQQI